MYIDIILLLIIIISLIIGIKRGLIFEFFSLFGIITAAFLARKFVDSVYNFFVKKEADTNLFLFVFSYIITFLAVYIVLYLIILLLKKFFETILLGWVDRLGGGIVGIIKGFLLSFIILIILTVVANFNKDLSGYLKRSYAGKMMSHVSPAIIKIFPTEIETKVNKFTNKNYVNGKNIDELLDSLLKENGNIKIDSKDLNKIINERAKQEKKENVDEEFINKLLNDLSEDQKKNGTNENESKTKEKGKSKQSSKGE